MEFGDGDIGNDEGCLLALDVLGRVAERVPMLVESEIKHGSEGVSLWRDHQDGKASGVASCMILAYYLNQEMETNSKSRVKDQSELAIKRSVWG